MKTRETKTTKTTKSNAPARRSSEFESVSEILSRMFTVRGGRLERHTTRARPDDEGRADGQRNREAYEQVET